jgi:glycosyltransferase involved in cell wall biosynthesis
MQSASPKRDVCVRALLQARFVVAFSQEMVQSLTDALSACPLSTSLVESLLRKVSVIHQSVSIPQRSIGDATPPPSVHAHLGLDPAINVILLPAALRPIKDPLFLLEALCLHSASCAVEPATRFCLLIVGPSLDEDTLRCVQDACAVHPQVCKYTGLQPRQVVLHWMASCFCVANTSHSEGMSGTILEAMAVGCPVLARRNAGNCGLVNHRVNGFLFSSATEALQLCVELAGRPALRTEICSAAAESISRGHSRESEMIAFECLLRNHNVRFAAAGAT